MDGKNSITDSDYIRWIDELKQRYQRSQIKAAIKVNSEMLKFYWSMGKDIEERQFENKYGSHFYENLSRDLILALNNKKGFSPTNLKYSTYFYRLYSPLYSNRQQLADDFEILFCIPWAHHHKIIDKVKGDCLKAMFFVRKTWENQWGRGALISFLNSDLYERQGVAQTNFQTTLPAVESDLAQQLLKDPYCFNFTHLKENYSEKELKKELINKLSQFLLELGKGFSFVGQEYRLSVGGKDKYIDLLFYIIPLHRYCVIEVKTTEFDFQDIGQIAGYTAMIDDLLNTAHDNPSIGLLICKEKNSVLVRYALSRVNAPIGISEYDVEYKQLPKELQNKLPTIEEIEKRLK